MAILSDIKGISRNVEVSRDNALPEGYFLAKISINDKDFIYVLKGTYDNAGATVKGRVEVSRSAGNSMRYFLGSVLVGGKAAGPVSSIEEAYFVIASDF